MKVLDWVLGKTINYPSGSLHLEVLGIGYRHNLVGGGGESPVLVSLPF